MVGSTRWSWIAPGNGHEARAPRMRATMPSCKVVVAPSRRARAGGGPVRGSRRGGWTLREPDRAARRGSGPLDGLEPTR